jgi:hypothetical protein
MRVAAQLLDQPRVCSVVDVVRNLGGVQAQVPATWSAKQFSIKMRIELGAFRPLSSAKKSGVADEAREIAAFLGVPVEFGS